MSDHKHHSTAESQKAWVCRDCETIYTEEADVPRLWECSREDCGTEFVSEDRACPDCNRPFSRITAEHGCEDCSTEVEEIQAAECDDENCGELFEVEAPKI